MRVPWCPSAQVLQRVTVAVAGGPSCGRRPRPGARCAGLFPRSSILSKTPVPIEGQGQGRSFLMRQPHASPRPPTTDHGRDHRPALHQTPPVAPAIVTRVGGSWEPAGVAGYDEAPRKQYPYDVVRVTVHARLGARAGTRSGHVPRTRPPSFPPSDSRACVSCDMVARDLTVRPPQKKTNRCSARVRRSTGVEPARVLRDDCRQQATRHGAIARQRITPSGRKVARVHQSQLVGRWVALLLWCGDSP